MDMVKKGNWGEIEWILLDPSERPETLPPETRQVPFRVRAKGRLQEEAFPGETVSVVTACGRELQGVLLADNPPFTHSFGSPIPELLGLGDFLRSLWESPHE